MHPEQKHHTRLTKAINLLVRPIAETSTVYHLSQEDVILVPEARSDRWGNSTTDHKPDLFKIYGKVTGRKNFWAFVTLRGIAGKVKGMP